MHSRRNLYGQSREQSSGQGVVLACLEGVVAGPLLAPKPGEETRAALDETIERGKHFMGEKTADAKTTIRAGRESMKEKMDKCCR